MNWVSVAFVVVWNLVVFFIYYYDKRAAINGTRRVPEIKLITYALCFGALGAYAGMKIFHHKTQHSKFMILVPIFLIVQLVVVYLFIRGEGYL